MNTAMVIFGALGAVVFLLVLIVSCLPSSTVRDMAKRFFDRRNKHLR